MKKGYLFLHKVTEGVAGLDQQHRHGRSEAGSHSQLQWLQSSMRLGGRQEGSPVHVISISS